MLKLPIELTQQDATAGKLRGLFLESPETFRVHFGGLILFVYSIRRRLEARHFAVILIFIPFTTYEKTFDSWATGVDLNKRSLNPLSGLYNT